MVMFEDALQVIPKQMRLRITSYYNEIEWPGWFKRIGIENNMPKLDSWLCLLYYG